MSEKCDLYDIELVYNEIHLLGAEDEYTDFDVNIKVISRNVTAKIPNSILPGKRIKLRGLGKIKPDGTYGNVYISFNEV